MFPKGFAVGLRNFNPILSRLIRSRITSGSYGKSKNAAVHHLNPYAISQMKHYHMLHILLELEHQGLG